MKKIFAVIFSFTTIFSLVCLTGCSIDKYREEHTFESGNFICYALDDWNYVEVIDLSEEGHKQKTIIMPESINGKSYMFTDSSRPIPGLNSRRSAQFSKNDTLEKIFFEYPLPSRWSTGDFFKHSDRYNGYVFSRFTNLKKIIVNDINDFYNVEFYYNVVQDNYYNIADEGQSLYTNKKSVPVYVGENGVKTPCFVMRDGKENSAIIANVEFMYNYDGAPNSGYYWIDDIDDGEKLEVMPPEPTREGYIFGGWYQEEDCINEFDFESAIEKPQKCFLIDYKIGTEPFDTDLSLYSYPDNYVTFIYAKWIEE